MDRNRTHQFLKKADTGYEIKNRICNVLHDVLI